MASEFSSFLSLQKNLTYLAFLRSKKSKTGDILQSKSRFIIGISSCVSESSKLTCKQSPFSLIFLNPGTVFREPSRYANAEERDLRRLGFEISKNWPHLQRLNIGRFR